MIISGSELYELKQIEPMFKDEIRQKFKVVTINGFSVSGVHRFKIADKMVFVCDERDQELARIGINTIKQLEINEEFGDYKFVLHQ